MDWCCRLLGRQCPGHGGVELSGSKAGSQRSLGLSPTSAAFTLAVEYLQQKSPDQANFLLYKFMISSLTSAIFLAKQPHFSSWLNSRPAISAACLPPLIHSSNPRLLSPLLSLLRISQTSSKRKLTRHKMSFSLLLACIPPAVLASSCHTHTHLFALLRLPQSSISLSCLRAC